MSASTLLAIAGLVGAAAGATGVGVNWAFSSKQNKLQRQQLDLQKEQYNENLRSNYYSYMQQLASMEDEYAQNQLSINQTTEDIASNQNYLDRWAGEYDQSMQSNIDDAWNSYQSLASNFSSGLVVSAEKGQRGGSAARINADNALALKSVAGSTEGFSLDGSNRLGAYVQSSALDMLADRQTALSSISTGYQSINSYKDAMKSLEESIGSMKVSTSDIKKELEGKGLTV